MNCMGLLLESAWVQIPYFLLIKPLTRFKDSIREPILTLVKSLAMTTFKTAQGITLLIYNYVPTCPPQAASGHVGFSVAYA